MTSGKVIFVSTLLVVTTFNIAWFVKPTTYLKEIQAERFVLVDRNGNEVGSFGVEHSEGCGKPLQLIPCIPFLQVEAGDHSIRLDAYDSKLKRAVITMKDVNELTKRSEGFEDTKGLVLTHKFTNLSTMGLNVNEFFGKTLDSMGYGINIVLPTNGDPGPFISITKDKKQLMGLYRNQLRMESGRAYK